MTPVCVDPAGPATAAIRGAQRPIIARLVSCASIAPRRTTRSNGLARAGSSKLERYLFAKTERLCYVFPMDRMGTTPSRAGGCCRGEKGSFGRSAHNLAREFETEQIFLFGFAVTH